MFWATSDHLTKTWWFPCGPAWHVVTLLFEICKYTSFSKPHSPFFLWLQWLYLTMPNIDIFITVGNENNSVSPSSQLVYFWGNLYKCSTEKIHILSQGTLSPTIFLQFPVTSLFANFFFPEAFELTTSFTAEDFPTDVLIIHPLNKNKNKNKSIKSQLFK